MSSWQRAVRVALGLVLLTLVLVAAGASGALGGRGGTAALASATNRTFLVCLLAALVAVVTTDEMLRRRGSTDRRARWTVAILLMVAAWAVLAAVAVAGMARHPSALMGRHPTQQVRPMPGSTGGAVPTDPPTPVAAPDAASTPTGGGTDDATTQWLLGFVAAAALLGGGALAVVRARRTTPVPGPIQEDEPAPDLEQEQRELDSALSSAERALGGAADPRVAVIAAYEVLEQHLTALGRGRSAGETPAELLRRMRQSDPGAAAPAERLTSAFERARYSSAPVTEQERAVAADDLAALRGTLRVGAVS